jgi:conjugative transfer region protein TrbK
MNGKMLARLGAVVFVGIAITVTVVELTRTPDAPEVGVLDRDHIRPADPLRASLRRCRDIGEAAARDPACRKAWVENRDRFLGQGSSATSASPAPTGATTMFAAEAASSDDPLRKEAAPTASVAPEPNGAH